GDAFHCYYRNREQGGDYTHAFTGQDDQFTTGKVGLFCLGGDDNHNFDWIKVTGASASPTPTSPPNSPTPTPTSQPGSPTYTPRPSPTRTPQPCGNTGVIITMPSTHFRPGDICSCSVTVCNSAGSTLTGYPLFVILDAYGSYFFAPSFGEFDYFNRSLIAGETVVEVLPEFLWPSGAGNASGIVWYSALTNPEMTTIVGAMGTFSFGWSENVPPTPTSAPGEPTNTPNHNYSAGDLVASDNIVGNMRYVPPGSFIQGSPESEPCRNDNETQFTHTLTNKIAVMESEVTRQMWMDLQVVQGNLPVDPSDTDVSSTMNHPVQKNTWFETMLFANLLSLENGFAQCYFKNAEFTIPVDHTNYTSSPVFCNFAANGYRLPSEREWEYSCRAGITEPFSCYEQNYTQANCNSCSTTDLSTLENHCVFCVNDSGGSETAGIKNANPWNLRDVHGNVAEWCWDRTEAGNHPYPSASEIDYTGPDSGSFRVFRGGNWETEASLCRSAARAGFMPPVRRSDIGFRFIRSIN
ncbi:formylglycine-generating enzyme family protein, partial [bacterium]|nr:formylglycine-generating enzyme family protein [bacterium]